MPLLGNAATNCECHKPLKMQSESGKKMYIILGGRYYDNIIK